MSRRLVLALPYDPDPWRAYNLVQGFSAVAAQAEAAGWEIVRLAAAGAVAPIGWRQVTHEGPPVIAGPGSAAVTRSLHDGYRLARHLARHPADIVLAPLRGGILQPLLMARAVGEIEATCVAVWRDPSTRERWLAGHEPDDPLAALVEDALERTVLSMADAVIGPLESDPARRLVLPAPDAPPPSRATPGALVFAGPGSTSYGADRFLSAIETWAQTDQLPAAGVTLLGPWRETARGLSKTLLGVRAQRWRFAFTQRDAGPETVARLAPDHTVFHLGPTADDEVLVQQRLRAGGRVVLSQDHRVAAWAHGHAGRFDPSTLPGDIAPSGGRPNDDWTSLLESLARGRPEPTSELRSVSLCILHQDRPAELRAAFDSIDEAPGDDLEILVIDNGSRDPDAKAVLRELEQRGARILRLAERLSQGEACNRAAEIARGEVLVFLDDDNRFIDQGWSRMAAPLADGRLDIVVSTLALVDAGAHQPSARLCFLGEAGSAGLFFNGFGDGNLAVRADAFRSLGGFGEDGGPARDWVFLAGAVARGRRIGVLSDPAIAYRRRLDDLDRSWRKHDQEGARRAVLAAYDRTFDAELVGRLAQALSLPILD